MRSFQSMGCGIVLKLIAGCEILTPERPFQNQGGIGIIKDSESFGRMEG